jgi:hypothetical protein
LHGIVRVFGRDRDADAYAYDDLLSVEIESDRLL